MKRRKLVTILLITAVLAVLGIGGYFVLGRKTIRPAQPSPTPKPQVYEPTLPEEYSRVSVPTPTADTTTWATYTGIHADEQFELKYSNDLLQLNAEEDTITLRHSIPFRHIHPCYEGANPTTLDRLTDVDITMRFMQGDLRDAIYENGPPEFLSEYFYYGDVGSENLRLTEGFIDFIDISSLHGYRITSGVEGCGRYMYFFPSLREGRVLVVERTYGELTSLSTASQEYRKLPGVIQPDEEEKIVHSILSTFKELGPVGPARRILEFETALNANDGETIASLLTERVWYILEATECCGWTAREQMVLKLTKGDTTDFSENQPALQEVKNKRLDLRNYTIGINGQWGERDAAGIPRPPLWKFTAYHTNTEGKVDRIRIGLYP